MMDDSSTTPSKLSAAGPTVDMVLAKPVVYEASGTASADRDRHAPVALVEQSDLGLTAETLSLLRGRLRLAGLLMFFGYLLFLPQHIFQADFSRPGHIFLFAFHCGLTIVLGVLSGLLCRRCQIPVFRLRLAELAMFGLSAAFLVALQSLVILGQCVELMRVGQAAECEFARLRLPSGLWLLLIFTYALFVPNTWRRAAVVIGILAATPIVMILTMMWGHEEVRRLLTPGEVTGFSLIIVVAAVTGLFGVDTIGSLRRQVFEAKQLGQYRLKRRIGAGGMGEVYLAEHQLLKRPCVIKLIRPEKAGDPKVLARFQREVRATAKLSHWNTVEIFDYGSTEDDVFYYVMEYLPGMSLAELVERYGPLPPGRVIYLLRQACDALCEAHAAGLIHRDIKPGNIFAAQRGGVFDVAKLLDFGLVKPVMDDQPIQLTTDGAITGSPLFMSPEQATGEMNPDARSDIYSLGAVGYYLLTGRPPFVADRPIKVMIAHAHEQVTPPSAHSDGVPSDLEEVILRCLAKAPADRYPSAAEMSLALSSCESAAEWDRDRAAQWWQEVEVGLVV